MAAYSQYFFLKLRGWDFLSLFQSWLLGAGLLAATSSDISLFRLLRKEKLKTALLFL
jgi:hypothetical protein